MTTSSGERRLTARVHAVWAKLAGTGLPRRSQINPADFGIDWGNCLLIDVDRAPQRSRFTYVGIALRDPTLPSFDRQPISEAVHGSLLELATRHIPRIAATCNPISFGGSAVHDECSILFRAVLLPLSEAGDRVDGVLGALGFREVVATADEKTGDPAANGHGRVPKGSRRPPWYRH